MLGMQRRISATRTGRGSTVTRLLWLLAAEVKRLGRPVQATGRNDPELLKFCPDAFDPEVRDARIIIHTLEGDMMAMPNDWIIKGVKGEFYPCKPDIFEATYERVEEDVREEDVFVPLNISDEWEVFGYPKFNILNKVKRNKDEEELDVIERTGYYAPTDDFK
jgi:hypothetical protein